MTYEVSVMAAKHVLVDGVEAVELHRVGPQVLVVTSDGVEVVVEDYRVSVRPRLAKTSPPITRRERNRRRSR